MTDNFSNLLPILLTNSVFSYEDRNLIAMSCRSNLFEVLPFSNRIFLSLQNSTVSKFDELILQGAYVNAKNRRGQNVLSAYIVQNETLDEEFLLHLITMLPLHVLRGQDSRGNTAFHYMCMKKTLSSRMFEALLQRDETLGSIRNKSGAIPLFFASAAHNLIALKVLLPFERNINSVDVQGDNALIYAMSSGLDVIDSVKLLIDAGVKIENVSMSRCKETGEIIRLSALDVACKLSLMDIASEFIKHGAKASDAAVHAAAKLGRESLLKVLLADKKVSPNSIIDGLSPLLLAVKGGHVECARFLLDFRGDILVRDPANGSTPLHLACESQNVELVTLLLQRMKSVSIELDEEDEDGETALFIAARLGNLSIAKLLIDGGADLNASDLDGVTVLMTAARNGHKEVVDWLLQTGAREDDESDDGSSEMDDGSSEMDDESGEGVEGAIADDEDEAFMTRTTSGMQLLSIVDAEQASSSESDQVGLLF
jgi:ankyrin repeat protein